MKMSHAAKDFATSVKENCNESMQLVSLFKDLKIEDPNVNIENEVETETETITSSVITDEEIESDNAGIELSNTAERYRALGKIIHFLRKHFLSGKPEETLTFEEILKQTKQSGISADIKKWLKREALPNNQRILTDGLRYQFKPTFKLKNGNDLITLLKEYDRLGKGGILMKDIRESLPNYREVLKDCRGNVIVIKRSFDRKRIVYYLDPNAHQLSDFEVQCMWRSLGLEDIKEVDEPSNDEFC